MPLPLSTEIEPPERKATFRWSIGLGSTSSSCLPLGCLYSLPTLLAICAEPPSMLVSLGCHGDQFLARPASLAGSPVEETMTATSTSVAATHTPASEPRMKPKRLRKADGPGFSAACMGCSAPERGGSGGSSIRLG